jgi:hypothetical protein
VRPGDLVRIRFWDEPSAKPLVGLIVSVKRSYNNVKYENTNFYKVWVDGVLSEFAVEELELISTCQTKNLK